MSNYMESICRYEEAVCEHRHRAYGTDKIEIIHNPKSHVLLSAPHATMCTSTDGKAKVADTYTYGIVQTLTDLCECSAILTRSKHSYNPNRDNDTLYRRTVKQLVKDARIRVLIDIHGCADRDPYFDVCWATNYDTTLCDAMDLRHMYFCTPELLITDNDPFHAAAGTIARYCSAELHIPAIELELSYKARAGERNKVLMDSLVHFINRLNKLYPT